MPMPTDRRVGTRVARALLLLGIVVAGCGNVSPTPGPSASQATLVTATASPVVSPDVSPSPSPSPSPTPTPSPLPTGTVPGIDGTMADAALSFRTPLVVAIDDNVVARPQAGFNAAALVYQAPADGGETRYMMVFQATDAKSVGPVRSGRPFFVRWAAEYRAGLAHYGGDYMTLGQTIPQLRGTLIFDLDALSGSGAAFHRVSSRAAPHNAYTGTAELRRVLLAHGGPALQAPGFDVRAYVDDTPLADRPAASTISVPYARGSADYLYDRSRDLYVRSVAGRAQVDAGDGQRVTARNVIVLFMRKSIDPNSEPGYARVVLDQIGSGDALVFREGRFWKATWRKPSIAAMTRVFDASGAEIPLVRGRTFIQVVPTGTRITYRAAAGS
jgi:hypothetical protein